MISLWFQQSWSLGQIKSVMRYLVKFNCLISAMCVENPQKRVKRTRALIFPLILLFHLCEYFIPQFELLGYICSYIQIKYVFRDNYRIVFSNSP